MKDTFSIVHHLQMNFALKKGILTTFKDIALEDLLIGLIKVYLCFYFS